jgi:pimeloyl-ACP methyl ester carboxylesterase
MTGFSYRTVDTRALRMHVTISGPDDGPAVLLCHGFPEGWYSWRHQLAALGRAGFRVLAPDQRGYGSTDAPSEVDSYTLLHLTRDLVSLLDALGISTAAIVAMTGALRWLGPRHCSDPTGSRRSSA